MSDALGNSGSGGAAPWEDGPSTPPRPRTGRWWGFPRTDLLILLTMIGVFAGLLTYFSQLRVENFYALNWDLGINQQMLWTTAHGRLLYETGDAEFYGTQSFLAVHSTYVALLVVPIYAAEPVPATLFLLQSLGLGCAAIPLYWIARRAGASRPVTLLGVVIFLGAFGAISGLLYDFHWEAFLPLEFLAFFYLATERRYLASLLPFTAGVLTLEVFPFLSAAVALYIGAGRLWTMGWKPGSWLRDRDLLVQLGVLVLSAGVYIVLRVAQYAVIPPLTGQASGGSHVAGAVSSAFSVGMNATTVGPSSVYWLLLLASFAFLPLLSPRALILSIPWFVNSFILTPEAASAFFGNQYALLALAGLSVGMVEGLAWVEQDVRTSRRVPEALVLLGVVALLFLAAALTGSRQLLSGYPTSAQWALLLAAPVGVLGYWVYRRSRPTRPAPISVRPRARWSLASRERRAVLGCAAVVVALVAFNATMTPLNTANYNATPLPGYQFQFGVNPMAAQMGWLTGFIPSNAQILASNNLFVYVANNPNAWAVPWFPVNSTSVPSFPFSPTQLPNYVLVDTSEWNFLPHYLATDLWNPALYGQVAVLFGPSYPGSMFLYERGFTGPVATRSAIPLPEEYVFDAGNLSLGPSGNVGGSESGSPFHSVRSGVPVGTVHNNSNIWFGPYVTLPAGNYTVTFNLEGSSPFAATAPTMWVLNLGSSSGVYNSSLIFSKNYSASAFGVPGLRNLTFTFPLPHPYPLVEFRGYLYFTPDGQPGGTFVLNYVTLQRH